MQSQEKSEGWSWFFVEMSITVIYKLILSFWWVQPGILKIFKITNMQRLCNISRKNWVMKLMVCMLIKIKVFYRLIVIFLMGLARHAQITWVNLQYLCVILTKKSRMKLGTALAGSCTTFTIYYTSNVLPLSIDRFPLSIWNPYQTFPSFD